SIAELLQKISMIRGVRRIRIGSLEPIQIDDAFIELLDEPWMAKHLHIALQHTSDKMLKLMNRRNRFATDIALFEKIASHDYALGTDFIVGHPGEEEKEWEKAIERIKILPLTHVHAFSYSKRDNTASATMKPEIHGNIVKQRHRELTELIKAKNYAFRRLHTHNLEVLLENSNEDIFYGFDQYFNKVEVQSSEDLSSNWILLDNVEVALDVNRTTV
ncbi:MAG: radical SAM protein, partial [Sulfurovum sp.]|nr:radical SAM protein [Sulfurovum sp.]